MSSERGAEKEESMELSWNPHRQAIDSTAKPKATSFYPLQKLKASQPVSKMAAVCHSTSGRRESLKREEEDET